MGQPKWVLYEVVLAVHKQQLAEHGGLSGVRDVSGGLKVQENGGLKMLVPKEGIDPSGSSISNRRRGPAYTSTLSFIR